VEQAGWEIGKVLQGTTVERAFVIENRADAPLKIERIQSSCEACTTFILPEKTVHPGQAGVVRVVFHARHPPGKFTSTVTIESNDPVSPKREITLTATIVSAKDAPRILWEPAQMCVGTLAKSEKRVVRVIVRNSETAKESLELTQVQGSQGCRVLLPCARKVDPAAYAVISVEVAAGLAGPVKEHLSIETNDPVNPVVTIPIAGTVSETAQPREAAASNGVIIEPIGEAIAVPGTGGEFCQKLFVHNGLEKTIRVLFPKDGPALAKPKTQALTLEPGESAVVELELHAEQVGKAETLPIRVEFPVIRKKPQD
jgi:hypothetical protein